MTSAPAIYRDLVIVGALAPEGAARGPAGDVRAFDVRTGQERWRFHTVPRPGEPGHDTWSADAWQRRTGVNVWTSMSVDEARGLVFLPLGSASYDFYGGDRPGRQSLRQLAGRARRGDRRPPLASAAGPSRHLGLRPSGAADSRRRDARRPDDSRRRAAHEDGARLRLRSGHRRAGVRHRGAGGAPKRCARREDVADAAVSRQAAAAVADCRADARRVDRRSRPSRGSSARRCSTRREVAGSTPRPGARRRSGIPGTMGGATWSGGAADPARGLLFVNTNDVGAVGLMKEQPPGAPLAYRRASPWGEYARFWDSSNLPCQQPPWGRLHAVDLVDGRHPLAGAAGQRAATGGPRHHRHRHAEHRRRHRDRQRPGVHRRHQRREAPRV